MAEKTVETQFGALTLREENGALTALRWGIAAQEDCTDLLERAAEQLREYDAGAREAFDLPLHSECRHRRSGAPAGAIPFR